MADVFNTTFIKPRIATSTMTGAKCSEVFTLNTDSSQPPIDIEDIVGGTAASDGIYVRVNSDGWSTLQVWWVTSSGDGAIPGTWAVMGKRPFTSSSMIAPAGSVYSLVEATAYLPCPITSSTVVNPGTDSDATAPLSPPMGTHQVGTVWTYGDHAGPILGVSDKFLALSDTNSTVVGGGIVVDVRGTTEITVQAALQGDGEGYYIGQFIA